MVQFPAWSHSGVSLIVGGNGGQRLGYPVTANGTITGQKPTPYPQIIEMSKEELWGPYGVRHIAGYCKDKARELLI